MSFLIYWKSFSTLQLQHFSFHLDENKSRLGSVLPRSAMEEEQEEEERGPWGECVRVIERDIELVRGSALGPLQFRFQSFKILNYSSFQNFLSAQKRNEKISLSIWPEISPLKNPFLQPHPLGQPPISPPRKHISPKTSIFLRMKHTGPHLSEMMIFHTLLFAPSVRS